ncbi:LysR substrate-binding domain-containing protein [Geodermatophilus sp. DSM 44513]|uniref:LysR family transcriptional regulator n=1 Tax=Geodermatophilus sp. DSM 44513 TaxID=1528104 RepID=UPI001287EB50|nr:LysR substrate-binding domain-containing protein [Geodermatophilus sp. DSM 44513]WNV75162.1 LysR substrate-binding domain-containing protein [Geodermatophilus sp. DSM 44513]
MAELTLVGLRVVQEVAAQGSFTAAADSLGYTQSAVSRQVGAMEAAAGAQLFERLPRGVRPTEAGVTLLRHAAMLLRDVEAVTSELAGLRDRLEGRVAIGAFPSALAVLVPRALARLGRAHPAVAVTLREGTTPTHLRRVRAGRLQLAVIATGPDLPHSLEGLRSTVLLQGRLMVAVATTHRLAGRTVVDLGELEDEPWVVGDAGGGDPLLGAWPGASGTPRVAYAVREWPARLGLVAAGLGIAVVPSVAAASVPPGVTLLGVDEPTPPQRTVVAVTAPDPSPGAVALLRALRSEAGRIAAAHSRMT